MFKDWKLNKKLRLAKREFYRREPNVDKVKYKKISYINKKHKQTEVELDEERKQFLDLDYT